MKFFKLSLLILCLHMTGQTLAQQAYNTLKAKSLTLTSETASRALVLDASKNVDSSSVTATELSYLSGASSSIQGQLDSKGDQSDVDQRVIGVGSSVDGEIMLFDSTTGKLAKRATGSGYVKATSGVYSTVTDVDAANDLTGIAPVANGGTGAASLTANNVILGNGTAAVQFVAPGASGNVLTSNGTTWSSTAPTGTYKKCFTGQGGASATLAAPTVCISNAGGSCVEVFDTCSDGTSGVFATATKHGTNTGTYTAMTVAAGTFAANSVVRCGCRSISSTSTQDVMCNLAYNTGNYIWTTNASGGVDAFWVVTRVASTGATVNTFWWLECEGPLP
jgi:hypothetical protein